MHAVSGTPGRVFDMIKRKTLRTRHIKTLVLDEADEMLAKNFKDQIYDIYRYLPPETQASVHELRGLGHGLRNGGRIGGGEGGLCVFSEHALVLDRVACICGML